MGLTNFDIQFEKPLKVFFSGEELRGRVFIDLSSQKNFREIKLEIVGRGEVHWTEKRTETRQSEALSLVQIVEILLSLVESFIELKYFHYVAPRWFFMA